MRWMYFAGFPFEWQQSPTSPVVKGRVPIMVLVVPDGADMVEYHEDMRVVLN